MEPDLRKAIELLNEAVRAIHHFSHAYCQLAYASRWSLCSVGSIILRLGWRWLKLLSKPRHGCVRMPVKRIWRARNIFIGDTAIMAALSRELEIARRALAR